jgi:hypothetical protein
MKSARRFPAQHHSARSNACIGDSVTAFIAGFAGGRGGGWGVPPPASQALEIYISTNILTRKPLWARTERLWDQTLADWMPTTS